MLVMLLVCLPCTDAAESAFPLKGDDVVVFMGGANVAGMDQSGHLESLLTLAYAGRKLHFRNLGWEADTVYQQPRDFNFPTPSNLLARIGATVIVMGFGQTEALQGPGKISEFAAAYDALIDRATRQTSRILLMTPTPFERPPGQLPDLSRRNADLARYVATIQSIATRRGLQVVDLFASVQAQPSDFAEWTDNGMHLSPRGQARVAALVAKQIVLAGSFSAAQEIAASGAWRDPHLEALRQAVIAKNRLWFDSWRPRNWAFLNGDRIEQPSSRDHRDPKVRWFPAEMERFAPLIYQAEHRIEELAANPTPPPAK